MNHRDLLDRIKTLDVRKVEKMSFDSMALLTDYFNESLVKNVIYVGKTNDEQLRLIHVIKDDYKLWMNQKDPLWKTLGQDYPKYMQKLLLEIEIGTVLKAEGPLYLIPAPCSIPDNEEVEKLKADNANLLAKVEQLEKEVSENRITQEHFNAIFDGTDGEQQNTALLGEDEKQKYTSQIQELQKQLAEAKKEIDELREEKQQLQNELNDIDEFLDKTVDEEKKLNLHQKIVFFTTVTSVLLDKRYTHLSNFANFISIMCNENKGVIGPMLSRMQKADEDKNMKETLHLAAQNVSDLLAKILKDSTRNDPRQVINKIRTNLLENYPSPEDDY